MYELSGVTCSGKSTQLVSLSIERGFTVLTKRWYHFVWGLFFLIKMRSIRKTFYILKWSFRSDTRLFVRMKVLYNAICKFYYLFSKSEEIVDEGFLQLPFLFLLPPEKVSEFFKLFEVDIRKGCFFWKRCNSEVVRRRLVDRGHHRFTGRDHSYIEWFTSRNLEIQSECEASFEELKIRVVLINADS